MPVQEIALGDILREHRRNYSQDVALVDGDRRFTYEQFDDRVNELANTLAASSVGAGDRVLWLGQNSFRVFELLGACAKLGAIICPAYWRWASPEIAFAIDDLAPKVIVWQETEIGDAVHEARSLLDGDADALWLRHDAEGEGEGEGSYEGFLASGSTEDPGGDVDPGTAVLAIYTAAMYGRPGASMLSHRNLINAGMQAAYLSDIDHTTVFLNSGPMFHIGNWQLFGICTLMHGGRNVVVARPDPEEVLEIIAAERCTDAFLLPPTIEPLVKLNQVRGLDISCLRASFAPHLWGDMASPDTSRYGRTERGHSSGYGQTEVSGMVTFGGGYGGKAIGGAGKASPLNTVRILAPDGRECEIGEVGEICVRGDGVHLGYWNRREVNEERFKFGYWHTTDYGQREADGSISFVGTSTRMLKSAGENIFPKEVELALEAHPAVKHAAVIGIPNERYLQEVKGIVVLEDGMTTDADEIIDHCKTVIASYKKPKSLEFIDAMPRTASGDKDYDKLDERFGGGGYPGGTNLGPGR